MVAAVCRAFCLVHLCIDVVDYPTHYVGGFVASIEPGYIDAEIQAEYASHLVVVFFDEVGHDPCCRIIVAIAIDQAQIACIVGIDCMMVLGSFPWASSDFHELVSLVI